MPIFMYHVLTDPIEPVGPRGDTKYRLPAAVFREQLALAKSHGFRPALVGRLWGPQDSADAHHPVGLTFDDGDVSNYTLAYPILVEADARADFFVNTATVGRPGFLSWPQITEMRRAGLSFQSHSHDHVVLVGLAATALERQLRDSKHLLEDRLGAPVDFLAAPYGLLNRRVVGAAREAGYRAVCTSWSWPARPGDKTVSRIAVYQTTTAVDFSRLLHGRPSILARRMGHALLAHIPKRVLLRVRPTWLGVQILETGR
ncbi:MAG: polysaccharide deacetylase family protein [Candidatus Rokuibacteriota bacterium]